MTPFTNRLPPDTTNTGNFGRTAERINNLGMYCFHAYYGNHSYIKKANHDYKNSCNPVYMKENIGHKIKRLRKNSRITQAQLAKALNISRVAITKWESGETKNLKNENLIKLCKIFNVSIESFLTGTNHFITETESNIEPAPDIIQRIPLISWVQAGKFCHSPDNFYPGDAEEWLPSIKRHGPHTYALRVKGESMVSTIPGAESFKPGIIIYVDPDKPLTNGAKVIARLGNGQIEETTFKIYSEDNGKRYLRPLNPQFPTIEMTDNMTICGIVVGAWLDV